MRLIPREVVTLQVLSIHILVNVDGKKWMKGEETRKINKIKAFRVFFNDLDVQTKRALIENK